MNLKEACKRILPRPVIGFIRVLQEMRLSRQSPFSGAYAKWDDVPRSGEQFDDDTWASVAREHSRAVLAANQAAFVPAAVVDENALLPLLAATHPGLSILDFGGATGFAAIAVKCGSMRTVRRFVVVEKPRVCEAGRQLLSDVEFREDIPTERFDLVSIGAALQYTPDYRALLAELARCEPRWFLFTKLPAGENETFVTTQVNMPGKRHAHWLFNVREIVQVMHALGYELIFRGAVRGEIIQDRFEPRHRVQRCCNLLFERTTND